MAFKMVFNATTLAIFSIFIFFPLPSHTLMLQQQPGKGLLDFDLLQLRSVVGPESLAFDCNGRGPYTGVSDGRILKWKGGDHGWVEFAFTSQKGRKKECNGSHNPEMESICGRPLGLQFNNVTCDLYIADASFGLLVVGRNGGEAKQLATSAERQPFHYINGLDIDQENGIVYFTDSSSQYQRRDYPWIVLTRDKTGRLIKYNIKSKEVTVLLRGLTYPNGVALSKDGTFILVGETTTGAILRFWLHGPKAGTTENFAHIPGYPDNIRRNPRGDFWVALTTGSEPLHKSAEFGTAASTDHHPVAMRLSEDGKVLETLMDEDGVTSTSISEVQEHNGMLWMGSLVSPYVGIHKL